MMNKPYTQSKRDRKKQSKRLAAGQVPKAAFNLRSIVLGTLGLLVVAAAVYFFLNREVIIAIGSDDTVVATETCTVTKMNSSREFDTSCGRMLWGEPVGLSPKGLISVGETYDFSTVGPRFPLIGLKPAVVDYKVAG